MLFREIKILDDVELVKASVMTMMLSMKNMTANTTKNVQNKYDGDEGGADEEFDHEHDQ